MEKITKDHPLSGSQDILADNIQKLKEIFPEVFSEGRVDFEKLQLLLGDLITPKDDLYGLNWWGKIEAIKESMKRSLGSLRPDKESSKNWDTTENLYIEGDNLEVLKLLQKSYNNKIKMIYIDPPYNTGKDFVYKDNYKDNLKNYLEQTGQVDSEGVKQSTNTKDDGRYHSNWLNMMYPRLKLARNLLKEDGVIFISIDDNEVANLKGICDEIFGSDNFEAMISWRRRHNQPNDKSKMIAKVSEQILVYSKNSNFLKEKKTYYGLPLNDSRIAEYTNPDNDPKGGWTSNPWKAAVGRGGSEYELTTISGKVFKEVWYGSKETFEEYFKEGRVHWTDGGDGYPRIKIYLDEAIKAGQAAINFFTHEKFGHNQEGSLELQKLLDKEGVFDNPKPTKLLKSLIKLATLNKEDIILDFFSGSGGIGDSILSLNIDEKTDRKFILVQLPENLENSLKTSDPNSKRTIQNAIDFLDGINKPRFLTEIGKERIRRVGDKIIKDKKEELDQLKAKTNLIQSEEEKEKIKELEEMIAKLDIGFKVFKLDSSNIESWDTEMPETVQGIQTRLEESRNHLKKGRTEEDLLYELLLKQGLLLTSPIEERAIAGAKVYSISHGELFICMNAPITMEVIEGIGTWGKESIAEAIVDLKPVLVLKDEAFGKDDAFKTNAELRLKNEFGFAKVNTL